MCGGGGVVACRIVVTTPVPVPFLWTLDFGLVFGLVLGLAIIGKLLSYTNFVINSQDLLLPKETYLILS